MTVCVQGIGGEVVWTLSQIEWWKMSAKVERCKPNRKQLPGRPHRLQLLLSCQKLAQDTLPSRSLKQSLPGMVGN
jgi:hypothetical protein